MMLTVGVALTVVVGGALTGPSSALAGPTAVAARQGHVSAHLTKTAFTASVARKVKLVYRFSSPSSKFGYVLSRKQGRKWLVVRRVHHRGRFTGKHSISVKRIFAGKRLRVARYRLKVSGSSNTVKLGFRIRKKVAAVHPQAGKWVYTSLGSGKSGSSAPGTVTVTGISFTVSTKQTVVGFAFSYEYDGVGAQPTYNCSGSGASAETTPAPIKNGAFSTPSVTGAWTGSGSGTFSGTFDSATRAHGTAQFSGFISGLGCMFSGTVSTSTFTWTAKRSG